MDLSFGTEGDEFRSALRSWLHESLPTDLDEQVDDNTSFGRRRRWNATLYEAGYAAIDWPEEFGGRDAPVIEQLIYNQEMARSGAPGPSTRSALPTSLLRS